MAGKEVSKQYQENVNRVVEVLKEGYITANGIADRLGLSRKNVNRIVHNIKNSTKYNIEKARDPDVYQYLYRIVGEINRTERYIQNIETFKCLPKVIQREDLIDWAIHKSIYEFKNVNTLIEKVKEEGIKVFKLNPYGKAVFY